MAKTPSVDDGFGPHMGLEMVKRGEARSLTALTVGPQHLNPHGVVHGAVLYALADQGMGAAVYSLLGDAESCATIEVKIVYLSPVRSGRIECESTVLNKGRRVAVLESEVRVAGKLVAKALGTFAIFPA
ncbi:MAG: PaaI family thioesterase [Actinomycetes bacterium]